MTKTTKKDWFTTLDGIIDSSNIENKSEAHEFIAHEIELLNRKSNKSETATQKANKVLMDQMVECLNTINRPVTITELQKECEDMAQYSNQKLAALFTKLVADNRVVKTVDKKKSYFSAV